MPAQEFVYYDEEGALVRIAGGWPPRKMPELFYPRAQEWVRWSDFNPSQAHQISIERAARMAGGIENLGRPVSGRRVGGKTPRPTTDA